MSISSPSIGIGIESIIGYLIVGGGIVAILFAVWRVGVRIERRITLLEGRIKALEDNPLLEIWREFEKAQAKMFFNPEKMLKSWEAEKKDELPKED